MSSYHGNVIWPFEQAFIHAAARKHGLEKIAEIAGRVHRPLEWFAAGGPYTLTLTGKFLTLSLSLTLTLTRESLTLIPIGMVRNAGGDGKPVFPELSLIHI